MTHPSKHSSSRSSIAANPSAGGLRIVVGVVLAVALLVGAGIWYFVFRDTAPERANISSAANSVDKETTKPTTGSSSLDGTWKVDTSIGSFDVDASDYTSVWVGYRVQEELVGIGGKTSFGRTPDVSGSMTINGTTATNVKVQADLTTLKSDESLRDGRLRTQAIETGRFPTATFELTQPIDFGDTSGGKTVSVDAVGDLTLHGVTKQVTVPLKAKLQSGTIIVTGSIDIVFADYEIEKPTSTFVLSIADRGVMELQLFFTK